MNKEIDITHSMKITNIDYYTYNIFTKNKIIAQYESISNIEKRIWTDGRVMLQIKGTKIVYGYKIEDRGFYDVINDKFYHQEYLD